MTTMLEEIKQRDATADIGERNPQLPPVQSEGQGE